MKIPLYVVAPGLTEPGTTCGALTSHVDLAATVAELGGVDLGDAPSLVGSSLQPLFADPSGTSSEYLLFAQDWPWYPGVEMTRYASSGIFDGRFKYCRYYGVGGGCDTGGNPLPGEKIYPATADFDDHDHELYDLQEDPYELVNLAQDRGRRNDLRRRFDELMAIEAEAYAPLSLTSSASPLGLPLPPRRRAVASARTTTRLGRLTRRPVAVSRPADRSRRWRPSPCHGAARRARWRGSGG